MESGSFDFLNGGGGVNTLELTGSQTLNLTIARADLTENLQVVDLTHGSGTTLSLDTAHVETMSPGGIAGLAVSSGVSSGDHTIMVFGGSGDTLNLSGWTSAGAVTTTVTTAPSSLAGSYTLYTSGSDHVLVSAGVHVYTSPP